MRVIKTFDSIESLGDRFRFDRALHRLAIVENAHRLRQAVREIGRCTKVETATATD